MSGMRTWLLLMAGTLFLGGCITPQNTRMPTLSYGDPRAERESYNLHDPLPETESGPTTSSRPLGFQRSRSEPRRTVEHSVPRNLTSGNPNDLDPGASPPPAASGASRYPQTVTP